MGTLSGNTQAATFQKLLKTEPAVNDTTLRTVESGAGVTTPLQLSTNKVKVAGDLEVTGTFTTANTASFSIVGPSPTIGVISNVGNVSTIDLGDTADPDNGTISYDNTIQEAVINVAGQSAASALRLSSTHLTTDKVVRTTSILTGLDAAVATSINPISYIHVYTAVAAATPKVTLPTSPVLGDTFIISNSNTSNDIDIASGDAGGTINGAAGNNNLPLSTSRTYICVNASNEDWIAIG